VVEGLAYNAIGAKLNGNPNARGLSIAEWWSSQQLLRQLQIASLAYQCFSNKEFGRQLPAAAARQLASAKPRATGQLAMISAPPFDRRQGHGGGKAAPENRRPEGQ
jgi:hypothetical protein